MGEISEAEKLKKPAAAKPSGAEVVRAVLKKKEPEIKIEKIEVRAPEKPVEEAPVEKPHEEKEQLISQLEQKLKKATEDAKKREKTQQLLEDLRERIREDKEASGEVLSTEYAKSDIEEITDALRQMKSEEEEGEKKEIGKKKKEKGPEEEIGESLVSYEKAYPGKRRKDDDVLKAVVGDVRQQMVEPKEEGEEEGGDEQRWYEKGPSLEAEKTEAPPVPGGDVELFEQDLSFGEDMGELGELGDLGGDLGDLSDLEGMSEGLETSDFDGMFVDVGQTKGGCPNCGKKGSSVVYCSNCGKPQCSNCAASVEGTQDFIKYKCPHCSEEFAMKRRMPS
jgi:hypothetical protein